MPFKTYPDLKPFAERREKLIRSTSEDAAIILFSGKESQYISRFRAQSHFVYLTGYEEAESWAVLRLGANPQYTLFVADKDPVHELWEGERFGPELAQKIFAADKCFSVDMLEQELPELLRGVSQIYFAIGEDPDNDHLILQARKNAANLDRRSGRPLASLEDPKAILASQRRVKDKYEIEWMRENCEISARAHIEVMKATRPGVNERALMGVFLNSIYSEGAFGEAYSSIVASGKNATVLHYRNNYRTLEDGDLLLIDAGSEKYYYAGDITRTYPVNGKFTPAQRTLYSAVLDVQKTLIEKVQVGYSLPELHELSCQMLAEKMCEMGLLKAPLSQVMEDKLYLKYYPHGVGHYLGMDVHDVGVSRFGDQVNPFVEGVVITVEPGIYIPEGDELAPKEFRGLGVRIEDDVLVTHRGPEVMTRLAPKEIADLESFINP